MLFQIVFLIVMILSTILMWYLMIRAAKAADEFRKAVELYVAFKRKRFEMEEQIEELLKKEEKHESRI